MVLEKHKFNTNKELIENAYYELLNYANKSEVGTWGYFPYMNQDYPFSSKLGQYLLPILGRGFTANHS